MSTISRFYSTPRYTGSPDRHTILVGRAIAPLPLNIAAFGVRGNVVVLGFCDVVVINFDGVVLDQSGNRISVGTRSVRGARISLSSTRTTFVSNWSPPRSSSCGLELVQFRASVTILIPTIPVMTNGNLRSSISNNNLFYQNIVIFRSRLRW